MLSQSLASKASSTDWGLPIICPSYKGDIDQLLFLARGINSLKKGVIQSDFYEMNRFLRQLFVDGSACMLLFCHPEELSFTVTGSVSVYILGQLMPRRVLLIFNNVLFMAALTPVYICLRP